MTAEQKLEKCKELAEDWLSRSNETSNDFIRLTRISCANELKAILVRKEAVLEKSDDPK